MPLLSFSVTLLLLSKGRRGHPAPLLIQFVGQSSIQARSADVQRAGAIRGGLAQVVALLAAQLGAVEHEW